jgi:hypothetical protein
LLAGEEVHSVGLLIVHAATAAVGSPWPAVAVVICLALFAFGVWMIIYPVDARRFMDHSQHKSADWFNGKEPRATPTAFPRVFGSAVAAFAAIAAALVIASTVVVL